MNKYLKYSTLAFQMGITIGLFVFAGYELDKHFDLKQPICTIVFSLLGVAVSLYSVVKDFIKPDK